MASLGSLCTGVGGLGLIIMSNLNLSKVKLMLGWVVTLLILQNLFRNQITFNPKDLSFHVDMELGCTDPYFGRNFRKRKFHNQTKVPLYGIRLLIL